MGSLSLGEILPRVAVDDSLENQDLRWQQHLATSHRNAIQMVKSTSL